MENRAKTKPNQTKPIRAQRDQKRMANRNPQLSVG